MFMIRPGRGIAVSLLAVAAALVSGCSLDKVETPALGGPSELATSVTLAAVPDQLPRDGSSQAVVTVNVRDVNGRPLSGLRLTLGVSPASARLSVPDVVTDVNGRATATVTAPPSAALGNSITVFATPVGDNAESAVARNVSIILLGASNSTVPTAAFTITPTSPEVNQVTTLDASTSADEGAPCGDACTYQWDFGGEATATGRIVTYRFRTARIYNVALTVTDAAGASATTRTNVTVTAAARPTLSITVSPTSPTAGQQATFTANTTVAANHSISNITWNFGDGTTTTTNNNSIVKTYSSAGTFIVTATVTDDLGQTASATATVTVQSGVTASFTFSPTSPTTTTLIQFNGSPSASTGGATIEQWTWDFGDGTVVETEEATVTHQYLQPGTYVVRLTVEDSNGRTGTTTQNVTVTTP